MTPYRDAVIKLGLTLKKGVCYDFDVRHDDDCAIFEDESGLCSCNPDITATPYVEARLRTIDGQRYAVIKDCPFCHYQHLHSPEPGRRVAHCGDHPDKPSNGYILVFK